MIFAIILAYESLWRKGDNMKIEAIFSLQADNMWNSFSLLMRPRGNHMPGPPWLLIFQPGAHTHTHTHTHVYIVYLKKSLFCLCLIVSSFFLNRIFLFFEKCLKFILFIYLFRKRERAREGGAERERERQKPKQAPRCRHRTHEPRDHDLGRNQESEA